MDTPTNRARPGAHYDYVALKDITPRLKCVRLNDVTYPLDEAQQRALSTMQTKLLASTKDVEIGFHIHREHRPYHVSIESICVTTDSKAREKLETVAKEIAPKGARESLSECPNMVGFAEPAVHAILAHYAELEKDRFR